MRQNKTTLAELPINPVPTDGSTVLVSKKHFLEMLARLKFKSGVSDAVTNHDKYIYDNPHNL